jgi:hypothetical protein
MRDDPMSAAALGFGIARSLRARVREGTGLGRALVLGSGLALALCYNCGGWSTAGAAAASAVVGAATATAVASANTQAATTNAYNAGVAAGVASTAPVTYVTGAIYPSLPSGCITPNVHGTTYDLCGNTWFKPSYGANGVFYVVVAAP